MTELAVELADLGGWADQVGRAGHHCNGLASYISTNVPDGDFGRILSLIQDEYEGMTTKVRDALVTDHGRLGQTKSALDGIRSDFQKTDEKVAQGYGVGARITDDGRAASAFADRGATTAAAPGGGGETLPEVSFGWILDKACELISWVGGPDLRTWVTDQIAGDVGKASTQASAWSNAATAMQAIDHNLTRGDVAIGETWKGAAATSAHAYLDQWITSLQQQAKAMHQVSTYLHDMVKQSVDMAQLVVDIVKEIISIISAGWSMASIPIYGEIKLVEKVKDAIKLVNDARKVITVFWNGLKMIISTIHAATDVFTSESLPSAPSLPGAPSLSQAPA